MVETAAIASFLATYGTAITAATAVVSTGAALYAQKASSVASKAEAKYQQQLLQKKANAERATLSENTRRQLIERQRQLSQVRVNNAASGFDSTGTQLAVFGEIESRLDDRINQGVTQGFNQISSYYDQLRMSQFSETQRKKSELPSYLATGIKGVTSFVADLKSDYDRYGSDAFDVLV